MSISTGGTDMIGGGSGYGFGGGGFGGIAPIGLIGLNTFLGGRGGFGNDGFGAGGAFPGAGIVGSTVADQNISELRKDVQGVNTTIESLGNEIAGSQFAQTIDFNNNFRNLDNRLCDSEKSALASAYAQSLQAFQNTQVIQGQLTNMQNATDMQFCSVKELVHTDGDLTRSLITQNLIDDLRNQLLQERRGRDSREIEISVNNSNTSIQGQIQAQAQQQNQFLASMFNALGDQVNRAANSVVNVGSGTVAGGQSNNQANTKVNS